MKGGTSYKTFRLAILGIFTAIVILQNFVPFLGYIPIQPLNPTIIHITVIIVAVVMGPLEGGIIGGVWGVLCLIRAYIMPTSPIDPVIFTNPVVSVLPRVLVGVAAGYLYRFLCTMGVRNIPSAVCCGFVGSFVNTILVLGLIYALYREPYANFYQMDVKALFPAILAVIATNGVAEAVCAAVITPLIARPLLTMKERMK